MTDYRVIDARVKILSHLDKNASYHLRWYTHTARNGTKRVLHDSEYKAMQELIKERRIAIINRRRFNREFFDGGNVSGFSINLVKW